ncbi:DUF805 domain-containing protein [Campylobacterota bacterium]|nr:DUF805 domain-containing protein [Campylobacterota bacterium]
MSASADSIQKVNGINYFIDAVKNHYFDINGRTSRRAYWYFTLYLVTGVVVLSAIDALSLLPIIGFPILPTIFYMALFLPDLGISVRRLHDIDKSGWWALINAIPLIGILYFFYLAAQPGTPGSNRFDENPKGE